MSTSAEELFDLNQAGTSYKILAMQTGMTRAMVAGKIFRWKKKKGINRDFRSRKNQIYGEKVSNPAKKPEVKTTVVPLNIELDHLKNGQCRYPYGEGPYIFCGHPVTENSSYCAEHHRICFKTVKQKPFRISTGMIAR